MTTTLRALLAGLLLSAFAAPAAAQTYVDSLRRPKVLNGDIVLPNNEAIDNTTDDLICFQGQAGTDDTDFCVDADGPHPVLFSATDTTVEVSDILAMTGGATLAGAFAFTGTTWDLDPTGVYTLDMDAGQAITLTTADMDAAYIVQAAGGEDFIVLNYSAGTKSIVLGNATDNPSISQLGTGTVSLNNLAVGGGYGATGCTTSTAGVLQCNGAMTTDGNLTAAGALVTAGGTGFDTAAAGILNLGVTTATSFVVGHAAVTSFQLDADNGLTFAENNESLINSADATFDFTRNDAGTVVITASDDDAVAALTVQSGGAAALSLDTGGAGAVNVGPTNATTVAVTPAATFTATADFDAGLTLTAGQSIDTAAAGALNLGTTTATSIALGSGVVTDLQVTTDGTGTAEVVLPTGSIDGGELADDTVDGVDLADLITLDATLIGIANAATGTVDLNFHDYADTADDDMAHATIAANCTDAGTGAEDCDLNFAVAEAGAAVEVRLTIDADGGVTVGGANNGGVFLLTDATDGAQIRNNATGNVLLSFRDYADSADDDMAHVLMTANCTDATTGAEDCDFLLGVVEAGAAAETRFSVDADGGIVIGSANNDTINLTTDGTGDAEVVLPTGSVGAAEILDLTRSVPLPLGAWYDCGNAAIIAFEAGGNDALPDYVSTVAGGPPVAHYRTIVWDDGTDGTIDTDEACIDLTLPPDWVSGATLACRVAKDAETGANAESIEASITINATGNSSTATAVSGAAQAEYTVAMSVANGGPAAGSHASIRLSQGGGTPDDDIQVAACEFRYTATQ